MAPAKKGTPKQRKLRFTKLNFDRLVYEVEELKDVLSDFRSHGIHSLGDIIDLKAKLTKLHGDKETQWEACKAAEGFLKLQITELNMALVDRQQNVDALTRDLHDADLILSSLRKELNSSLAEAQQLRDQLNQSKIAIVRISSLI